MDAAPDDGSGDQERVTHPGSGSDVDDALVISGGVDGAADADAESGTAPSAGDQECVTHPAGDAEVDDALVISEEDATDPAATDPAATDPAAPTPAPARGPDRTRRALIAGAALLAVLGVALVGWALAHQTGPPPAPVASGAGPPPPPSLASPPPGRAAEPAEPLGSSSPPVTLTVPAIRVASPVDQVGLNPDRTMEVPAEGSPGYDHAAWFRYSVTPGRQGPSVIIGHVDSAAAGPSVFYELGRLRPGDRAEVARADGATVTFEVTEVAVYPKDGFPTDRVYGPTPGPELRLITCGGSFDSSAGSYRDNTVVYAREVPR
ncbi:class F sortase [Actinomycetospora sp. C-140]